MEWISPYLLCSSQRWWQWSWEWQQWRFWRQQSRWGCRRFRVECFSQLQACEILDDDGWLFFCGVNVHRKFRWNPLQPFPSPLQSCSSRLQSKKKKKNVRKKCKIHEDNLINIEKGNRLTSFLFFERTISLNVVRFVLISIVKKINRIQFGWDFFRVSFLQIGKCTMKMIRISRFCHGIFHWLRVVTKNK